MSNIVILDSGDQPVQVRLEGETVWLSQVQMAELFGTSTVCSSQGAFWICCAISPCSAHLMTKTGVPDW